MHADPTIDVRRSSTPIEVPGSRVRVAFCSGNLARLGAIIAEQGATRIFLVTDKGIAAAGHVGAAVHSLHHAGVAVRVFEDVEENPTTAHVARGLRRAQEFGPDLIVGLGGGSSMDCAKGINFLLTNGGTMQDYWGVNKATRPLLPFVAVPTTAGTGSDAQSFALITDPDTHQKMACGDAKALPVVAVLDPDLTRTQPRKVAAATGIDAVAHAVETAGTTRRNETSLRLSLAAWRLLEPSFARVMSDEDDVDAREKMLLGAHLAGAAIENSMLGAAHSVANALTASRGIVHGIAVGLMLPHVVKFNAAAAGTNPYAMLEPDADRLVSRIDALLEAGHLPRRLSELEIDAAMIPELSAIAAKQWTATFNPVKVAEPEFARMFEAAM